MKLEDVRAVIGSKEVVSGRIGTAQVEGRIAALAGESYFGTGSPKVILETDQQGPPRRAGLQPGQNYVRYSHLARAAMPTGFRNDDT